MHKLLLLCFVSTSLCHYEVPEPRIEVLRPKGFKVSIPDEPGVQLFAFHGNVNKEMDGLEAGHMSKDVLKKRGGRWVFEEKKLRLKKGDVVYYWLYVLKDGLGYRLDDGVFEYSGGYRKIYDSPWKHNVKRREAIHGGTSEPTTPQPEIPDNRNRQEYDYYDYDRYYRHYYYPYYYPPPPRHPPPPHRRDFWRRDAYRRRGPYPGPPPHFHGPPPPGGHLHGPPPGGHPYGPPPGGHFHGPPDLGGPPRGPPHAYDEYYDYPPPPPPPPRWRGQGRRHPPPPPPRDFDYDSYSDAGNEEAKEDEVVSWGETDREGKRPVVSSTTAKTSTDPDIDVRSG